MAFAVAGAATDRRSHTRRIFWVNPIHVERDVIAGGAAPGGAQGFFNDLAHASLVNIAHGIDLNASLANVFALPRINIAHAHQHAVFCMDFGRKIVDVGQFCRA